MRSLLFLFLAVATSSCLIVGDSFGTRFCKTDGDCPGIVGYLCVSSTVWPQTTCSEGEDACVCEVKFPPDVGGIGLDGGGVVIPDAGPPPDYCTEIKPIIMRHCIATCHSSQMQWPGTPPEFRLDYWEPDDRHKLPDGGVGLPGVKAKIDRVKARIYDDWVNRAVASPMPPAAFMFDPNEEERKLVNRWITRFGAPLGDGGCELPSTDAGTPDAGPRDGGVDAGVVRFATQILPIFTGNCGCHTQAMPPAGLSLTAANAYNMLVNTQVSAGCLPVGAQRMRVLPNQPTQSQLWLKISNDVNKCGNLMPRNAVQPLSLTNAAQFDLITRWIQQGALNN